MISQKNVHVVNSATSKKTRKFTPFINSSKTSRSKSAQNEQTIEYSKSLGKARKAVGNSIPLYSYLSIQYGSQLPVMCLINPHTATQKIISVSPLYLYYFIQPKTSVTLEHSKENTDKKQIDTNIKERLQN